MSSTKKYVIVGAGISGVSAAVLLAQREPDAEIEVWEASKQAGGLLAPVPFCEVECDRGSHRIHPKADPLLLSMTRQQKWLERPRRGMLILNQKHIAYPPNPVGFLRGLGTRTSLHMGIGFLRRPRTFRRFLSWEKARGDASAHDEGFKDFVIERVGVAAYEAFYRPYVEKVWGLDPADISRTVAKQRVSTSSPWETLLGAIRSGKGKQVRHFLYPTKGMADLIHALRDKAQQLDVQFRYTRKVDGSTAADIDASAILFSGHLSDISDLPALNHRGLYLLHLAFEEGATREVDTFYSPESKYWFGRVSQLEHFSPALKATGKHILCMEIPEGEWGKDVDFLARLGTIRQQLVDAGIVRADAPIIDAKQTFLPRVYPMYTRDWLKNWQDAMEKVRRLERVYPFGRQGLFLHCNIDHCVRMADVAVEHVSRGDSAENWLAETSQFLDLRVRD